MKRLWLMVCPMLVVALLANMSSALPPFKKAFDKKYIKKNENEQFKKDFKKAGCNVCHVKGQKDKSPQNEYGKTLNELIEGDAKDRLGQAKKDDKKPEVLKQILEELEKAFEKVEEMEAPEGDTFGERIKQGLLPVSLPEGDDDDEEDA